MACSVNENRRQALAQLSALVLGSLVSPLPARAQAGLDVPAIKQAAADADLHSVLVWRAGRMLVEYYRRSKDRPIGMPVALEVTFGPDVLHDMRSISKSVVALLVGQAVGRGQIDIATPVLDFYPALSGLRGKGHGAIRVSHLLNMASGLAWNETVSTYGSTRNDETQLYWDSSPARYVLDRPLVAEPGALWNYNGGHTVLLADILEQRTGRSLLDLARKDLFEPLGIVNWGWHSGLHGRPLAYGGLRLTPPDLLRMGQLLLAGGKWQGRQVVPAAWITATLRPSITIDQGPLGYSLHWWAGRVPREGRDLAWTAGLGNGGQRLFIVPEIDLAVVFTAGAYGSEEISRAARALFRQIVAAA